MGVQMSLFSITFLALTGLIASADDAPNVQYDAPQAMQLRHFEGRVRMWLFTPKSMKGGGMVIPADTETLYFRNGGLVERDVVGDEGKSLVGVSQPGCKVRFRNAELQKLPAPTNTALFPNHRFVNSSNATYGAYMPTMKNGGATVPQHFWGDVSWDPIFSVSCVGNDAQAPVTVADYQKHLGQFFGGFEFIGPDAEKNFVASMTRHVLQEHQTKLAAQKKDGDKSAIKIVASSAAVAASAQAQPNTGGKVAVR